MSYIQVERVGKSFGERMLFSGISFSLEKGDKTALIAKNGTGKTTLLRMIAGKETCDSGNIITQNDIVLRYLPQEPVFQSHQKIVDAVLDNCSEYRSVITEYKEAVNAANEQRLNKAIEAMDAKAAWDMESRLQQILGDLGLYGLNQTVDQLSGGEKKRLAIAATFIDEPDFVILDEPTNHLDLHSIEWLEQHLAKSRMTILMVTHDRYFLDRICNNILELDQKSIFHYQGNFEYFLEKRAERYETQEQQIQKAKSKLKQETEWANRMPKARGTKAKFRLNGIEHLKQEARTQSDGNVSINSASQRMGKKILNLHAIEKSLGDQKLIDRFSYRFLRYEKIGIVGNSGAGKTTLLNIIAGSLKPDNGGVEYGETIKIAYYRQKGLEFDENKRVIDIARDVSEVVYLSDGNTLSVERFLNQFLFPNEMHYQRVAKLSGGEKRRLYLLTVLMKNPNFLLLDEPTNDLDIMTLEVLEQYLENFQGTVVIVSHDRYFMDRIVDHIFVFNANGQIKDFPGNYTQLRTQQAKENNTQQKHRKQDASKKRTKPRSQTKLSYKEQKELDALDTELAALGTQKQVLEKELEHPDADPQVIADKSESYKKISHDMDEKELRWLELIEKKEQLESQQNK